MKYTYKIVAFLSILGIFLSCQREEIRVPDAKDDLVVGVSGDEMTLSLGVISPDPLIMDTKAVDPDGAEIYTMNFFCFDKDGVFLKVVPATFTASLTEGAEPQIKGEITVSVPHRSRIMHILCNLNMNMISDEDFEGKSESEVIGGIDSESGMLVYWARIEVPANVSELYAEVEDAAGRSEGEAVVDWITIETNPTSESHKGVSGKGNPIRLIRNQAKVTVASEGALDAKGWNGSDFVVTGFTVYNSNAYGTVAPYHSELGYPSFGTSFGPEQWAMESFVSLPINMDVNNDVRDVDDFAESFVFESPNTLDNPVEVIIKGYNVISDVAQQELYYKASIMDIDNGLLPIRRNHHYKFTVAGNLYNGSISFEDALDTPAANNIWLSIGDEVTSVADALFKLSVDDYVVSRITRGVDEPAEVLNLGFSVGKLGDRELELDRLSVSWVDEDQNVGTLGDVVFDTATGEGHVPLILNKISAGSDDVLQGTVVVQYRQLFRRIKVVVTPIFDFTPVYASSEGIQGQRDQVTIVFNVPDKIPEELYPFKILVSTNDLDVRSGTGQKLSIVTDLEEGYGERFDLTIDGVNVKDSGYKYIMNITSPGVKRLYLQTLEDQVLADYTVYVTLESSNFNMHHEPVVLSNVQYDDFLNIANVKQYSTGSGTSYVNYLLVPPKRYAPVCLNLETKGLDNSTGELQEVPVGVTTAEEFIIYSRDLNHYPDDDDRLSEEYISQFQCHFAPFNENLWGLDGRAFGFYPREDIPTGEFSIYMETNTPRSEEAVMIVSNSTNSHSVQNPSINYSGERFRSISFELSTYRPYRFASSVSDGNGQIGAADLTGEPTMKGIETGYTTSNLSVSFDVTSYVYTDGTSVDPFGTAFEVYVDAPMYTLSDNQFIPSDATVTMNGVQKPKLEQLADGRIVYRVDADRAVEAGYWTGGLDVRVEDTAAVSQTGERKTINLSPKTLSTSGSSITISADPEHIRYYVESYHISNPPIPVNLIYGESATPVPVGYTVSFYNKNTHERLYSTIVTRTEGGCDFYMNAERPVDWNNDPITAHLQVGGEFYSGEVASMADLLDNSTIQLLKDL